MFSKVGRSDQRSLAFHGSNSGKGAMTKASQASIARSERPKRPFTPKKIKFGVKALRRLVSVHALGLSRVDCGK